MRNNPGPYVVAGKLFFRLLDGSTICCECIAEPYASKIVEACAKQNQNWREMWKKRFEHQELI